MTHSYLLLDLKDPDPFVRSSSHVIYEFLLQQRAAEFTKKQPRLCFINLASEMSRGSFFSAITNTVLADAASPYPIPTLWKQPLTSWCASSVITTVVPYRRRQDAHPVHWTSQRPLDHAVMQSAVNTVTSPTEPSFVTMLTDAPRTAVMLS